MVGVHDRFFHFYINEKVWQNVKKKTLGRKIFTGHFFNILGGFNFENWLSVDFSRVLSMLHTF